MVWFGFDWHWTQKFLSWLPAFNWEISHLKVSGFSFSLEILGPDSLSGTFPTQGPAHRFLLGTLLYHSGAVSPFRSLAGKVLVSI